MVARKNCNFISIRISFDYRTFLKTNHIVEAEIGGVLTTESDDNSNEIHNYSEPFLDVEIKNDKNSTSNHCLHKVVHRLKIFYPNQYLVPASQLTDIDYNIKGFYKVNIT
jgi:hypothetical protein